MKTLPKTPQIFYKKQILILFSAILLLPILGNLLRPGFFATDDGDWMIIRFSAFHQEFVHGQIPVRFLQRLNNNYGYPVATFLYPGFMYLSEIPKLIGLGFIDSIKITLVASVIAAFCFSFFFLRKIFDDTAAILGAFLYIYSPYFLWDIYKRGSVGEVLALAVVPFIFWAIKTKKISFTSLGYGMLIISHNTMAFISIPILLLFQFFIDREYSSITPKTLFNILKPLLLGLSLAAFFWIPALLELKYTVFEKVDVSRWEEYFIGLSNIPLIGVANLLVFLVSAFVVLKFRNFTDKKFLLFICAFLISLFLFSPLSSLLWRFFPLGKTVQFPFRFLSLIVISSSYLLAYNFHFFSTAEILG